MSPIFGRRKRRSKTDAQASQLRDWRSSAQRVNRAWNAWLAADGAERALRYRAYVAALDAEEGAAAEVERMLQQRGLCETDSLTRT